MGDLVIATTFKHPRVQSVSEELAGVLPANTVLAIRPDHAIIAVDFLADYLSSDTFLRHARTVCSTLHDAIRLTVTDLANVPVPLYPVDLLKDFDVIRDEEQHLRTRADELHRVIVSFFNFGTEAALREAVNDVRLQTNIVEQSLQAATDPDFQIRTFYPFPIAYPYRLTDLDIEPTKTLYELHRVSEAIAAYIASLLLVLLEPLPTTMQKYVKRSFGGHGATFGNWYKIIVQGTEYLDSGTSALHRSLAHLGKTAFLRQVKELLQYRDDFHHPSGTGSLVGAAAVARESAIRKTMRSVMLELAFLCEHPLYLPMDYDVVRATGLFRTVALKYTGDHPGMRKFEVDLHHAVTKNDLCTAIGNGDMWRSLYPYLSVAHCPVCGSRETYYVDEWQPGKAARIRSFERGHEQISDEIGHELSLRLR
ncbi:MAG: hypothetical protein WBA57_05965 [Elainellaceae cyanobacterium]